MYDARKLSSSAVSVSQNESADSSPDDNTPPSLRRFCPQHLIDSRAKAHVTAAVYNYNGKEILGSYNDENIYLFDATHSDMADCIKVYEGHRNSATGMIIFYYIFFSCIHLFSVVFQFHFNVYFFFEQ